MNPRQAAVLVADDDPVNRLLLTRLLERDGHTVMTAADGAEAVDRLLAQDVDAVLLDILMPVMDGYEVLARIKGDEDLRHLPVIMISALEEIDSVVRCIELGADDHLPKPFNPVLLRARLSAGFARKRARDLEREYLEQVHRVVDAATALEAGSFDAEALDPVARRDDALGLLARVFQRMAHEVVQRERRLQEEVAKLRIEVDESRAASQVAEITATDYFRELQQRVEALRQLPDE